MNKLNKIDLNHIEESLIEIHPIELLLNEFQMNSGEFNRYDVVVKFLAIENYFLKNSYGFNLYNKMQQQRISEMVFLGDENYEIRFKKLINTFIEDGKIIKKPILINRYGEIVDGTHRLALALFFGIDNVKIAHSHNLYNCRFYYGNKWFCNRIFSETEIGLIEDRFVKIMEEYNVNKFHAFIWPPAIDHIKKIKALMNLYECKFIFEKKIQFNSKDQFSDFVNKLYEFDDTPQWKVDKKIAIMNRYDPIVYSITFCKKVKKMRSLAERIIYDEIADMKNVIRNIIMKYIDDYFYDIVLHMTDSDRDYYEVKQLMSEVERQ